MSIEKTKKIPSARELLAVLESIPDYMLDQPLSAVSGDGTVEFDLVNIDIVDIIEEGNRVQLIRLYGDEDE